MARGGNSVSSNRQSKSVSCVFWGAESGLVKVKCVCCDLDVVCVIQVPVVPKVAVLKVTVLKEVVPRGGNWVMTGFMKEFMLLLSSKVSHVVAN